MAERDRPQFGDELPQRVKRRRRNPGVNPYLQAVLPGMRDEDFDPQVREDEQAHRLREVLEAYHIDTEQLRRLAAEGADLTSALRAGAAPEEVTQLLAILSHLLRPPEHEQIKSPSNAAGLLMVEMGHLEQEQMRVLCLDTKNRLQKMHLVYQGSLNASLIRVGELFKEPVRLNSAAVIFAHNHPSADPTPSPEDVLVTREIVQAGRILDVDVLDHLVIGQGRWTSMRERGLGFGP